VRQGARFDVAVLDPPRTGAREALPWLSRLAVRRVVYVSCDAMTLGRDLGVLAAAGLKPRTVQPLDLMPHTAQLECVALLDAV
jgi:23S rRNA (uracil1939-C5)-methyltransferase